MLKRYVTDIVFDILRAKKRQDKENPIVGVALFRTYTSCMGMGTSYAHPSTSAIGGPGFNNLFFDTFRLKEVQENLEDKIKVRDVWFKREEVFFFRNQALEEWKALKKKEMGFDYIAEGLSDIASAYEHMHVEYGFADMGGKNVFHRPPNSLEKI